jgi:hypothetical protein
MNTLEKYHIYNISKQGLQINDYIHENTNPMRAILIKGIPQLRSRTHLLRNTTTYVPIYIHTYYCY